MRDDDAVSGFAFADGGLDDLGADAEDLDIVEVVEVVLEIEFGEPERDEKGGEGWGFVGGVEEGYRKIGSVIESFESVIVIQTKGTKG